METIARHRGESEATWFLNSLVTSKATATETGGTYGISEHLVTAASNPPPHVHTDEEEAFFLLDGEVAFEVNGTVVECRPGSFVLVPRGAVHSFRVLTETARMLVISSSSGPVPGGGVQRFFVVAGTPARARVLPEVTAPDPAALAAAAAAHGIEIAPPPGPDDTGLSFSPTLAAR
jgi:mannose-6-phosphate isomerase-like protein (cupin superfamily)